MNFIFFHSKIRNIGEIQILEFTRDFTTIEKLSVFDSNSIILWLLLHILRQSRFNEGVVTGQLRQAISMGEQVGAERKESHV
jgi:hypothetical protein